jgi:hypothetical protein
MVPSIPANTLPDKSANYTLKYKFDTGNGVVTDGLAKIFVVSTILNVGGKSTADITKKKGSYLEVNYD